MYSIDEFIIAVFCCVEDLLQTVSQGRAIRGHGVAPRLADSEVITMEIVAEYLGISSDKGIWEYFRRHWQAWFPGLGSRSSFVRQAAGLGQYKWQMQQALAAQLGGMEDPVHLVDGLPMEVCQFGRAYSCRSFKGEASYGRCAAKKKTYYGFRGHLCVSARGVITGFALTAAATDERDVVPELVGPITGLLIADKGYIRPQLTQHLQQRSIYLQTALRVNMHDPRPKPLVAQLMRVRRLVETVIGQLAVRFHLEHVQARDLWHLSSRLHRKLLAHTVCFWLGRDRPNPLAFEQLLSP